MFFKKLNLWIIEKQKLEIQGVPHHNRSSIGLNNDFRFSKWYGTLCCKLYERHGWTDLPGWAGLGVCTLKRAFWYRGNAFLRREHIEFLRKQIIIADGVRDYTRHCVISSDLLFKEEHLRLTSVPCKPLAVKLECTLWT